jgi:hypothetical protein
MRLHLEAYVGELQDQNKRSHEGGTLQREAKPAVMPQDRRRHPLSHVHDRLCLRRRSVVAGERAAGADAPQAATRATLALFAHGCVEARAFSF